MGYSFKEITTASIKARDADVNVTSWNRLASCMLASGSNDGAYSVRDLRMLKKTDAAAHLPPPSKLDADYAIAIYVYLTEHSFAEI
ncbi:hypothetical protein Tco_0238253 [Tanacetum coccineum]